MRSHLHDLYCGVSGQSGHQARTDTLSPHHNTATQSHIGKEDEYNYTLKCHQLYSSFYNLPSESSNDPTQGVLEREWGDQHDMSDRDRSARPHGPWCITEGPHRELASLWSTHWQLIELIEHIEQSRFQSKPSVCAQKTPLSQSWSVWLSEIGSVTLPWPCVTRQSHVSHVKVIKDISGPGWSLNCLVQLATPLHSFTLLYTSITNLVSCKSPPQCRSWLLIAKLQLPGRCQKIFLEMNFINGLPPCHE